MTFKDWNIAEKTGYDPKTTVYMDFSLAEPFGIAAVKDTYKRLFNEWKDNIIYLTELSMALNWKIWEHYRTNEDLSRVYDELWKKCCTFITEEAGFSDEDIGYYYRTTD